MIFVSTGQIKNRSIEETIKHYANNGIKNIELSGGRHDPKIINKLMILKNNLNFMLHNYFPPPSKPFTLNLASLNDQIYSLTEAHIKECIKYSAKLKIPYYSFHAGFLIDPAPEELGKKISKKIKNDEAIATEVFLKRLNKLAMFAKEKSVELLVENNVLSKKNYKIFNGNPLMMVTLKQTLEISNFFPQNVNILLDLAHLKVSSKTLQFSKVEYLKKLDKKIKAYHISENDGFEDSNDLITEKSWFLPYLKNNKKYFTLELKTSNTKLIKKQIRILEKYIN